MFIIQILMIINRYYGRCRSGAEFVLCRDVRLPVVSALASGARGPRFDPARGEVNFGV